MRGRIALVSILALACTGVYTLQVEVDSGVDRTPEVDLRYLLQADNLRRVSCGYPQVVADLVWIKSIQFYHQQFVKRIEGEERSDAQYKWLDQVADLVTDLNPKFVHAYWFFSLYLGGNERESLGRFDDRASFATQLLLKGQRENPETYFLSDALAFSYRNYYRRLEEGDAGSEVFDEVAKQALLDRFRERCLYFAEVAARCDDATSLCKLALGAYSDIFGGDHCADAKLLLDKYETYTQDAERLDSLFPAALALDRCHIQQLEHAAEVQGIELQPGDGAALREALGIPALPRCPWGALDAWSAAAKAPPEKLAALFENPTLRAHPYEYFVSTQGEVLSHYQGDRRQGAQRAGAAKRAEHFEKRFGFTIRDLVRAAELSDAGLVPNPFGRRYLWDPVTRSSYPEYDLGFVEHWLAPQYDRAPVERRLENMKELVLARDAGVTHYLRLALERYVTANPDIPLEEITMASLTMGKPAPPAAFSLLDRYAEADPETIPASAADLFSEVSPDESNDYVITPEGEVLARPVALGFRASLMGFLQERVDLYWEEYGVAPELEDLSDHFTFAFPSDPLGATYTLDSSGKTVVAE